MAPHQSDIFHDTPGLAQKLTSTNGKGPSPRTIERWRNTGYGPPFVTVGRRVLYRERDVDRWLERQTRSFTSEIRKERG